MTNLFRRWRHDEDEYEEVEVLPRADPFVLHPNQTLPDYVRQIARAEGWSRRAENTVLDLLVKSYQAGQRSVR